MPLGIETSLPTARCDRATTLAAALLLAMAPLCAAFARPATADEKTPAMAALVVAPQQANLVGPLDRVQLVVSSATGVGRHADLTREVEYKSLAPEILAVSATGLVRPLADGNGRIEIRRGEESAEVEFEVSQTTDATPTFRNDVIPILNRAGCSGGSCHGAQYGQAGFKLSLFGYAPEEDYEPIVRDRLQRRISLVRPEDSLILRKATLQTAHGGGKRFEPDSYEYNVLLDWLRAGAPGPKDDAPRVVDLTVTPHERVYKPGEGQQLRVVATYSDGATRDVTAAAIYDSMSEAVAEVAPSSYIKSVGAGQAAVMVRYMGQAKVSMVVSPFSEDPEVAEFEPRNFIDEAVLAQWKKLGLSPSGECTDEEFIRRAFLDSIGTLPSLERVQAFLESDAADKREQLVDELLGLTGDPNRDVYVNEWSAYWALKWGDLLRNNRNELGDGGMWSLYNWTRASLRENKPVDKVVRELITAQGSVFENGPANYYKITNKPDELAEATAQIFLGVRLTCAKCHHHPFEAYSQKDYYSLAAFFTRVATKSSTDFGALGGDTVVMVKPSGSIRHPRTREVMQPTPLAGEPIDESNYRDLRRALAEWITAPENELFAKNIVNRFWAYYMGAGIVEPIDDMRATNPPSNPQLLDALAGHLVEQQFDLRQLMRAIMTSRVYQLSAQARPENVANGRFYTHYNVKRLPAEVFLDAIDFACGTQEKYSGIPAGTRAIELPDPNIASYFLDTMGRPQRVITCECERTTDPNLAQVLHIANGDVLSRKIADRSGRIAGLLKGEKSDDDIIAELYLCTFSRPPVENEIAACRDIIAAAENRQEGVEDVLWALCNSREFLFNH